MFIVWRCCVSIKKKKAEELEIKYRKEQGLPDFVPTGAKVSSVGDDAAADAEAESAAPVVLESTPETRAALVSRLSDLPDDSKSVVEAMNQLKAEGLAPRCVSEIRWGWGSDFVVDTRFQGSHPVWGYTRGSIVSPRPGCPH